MVAQEDLNNLRSYWQKRAKEVGSWEHDLWPMIEA